MILFFRCIIWHFLNKRKQNFICTNHFFVFVENVKVMYFLSNTKPKQSVRIKKVLLSDTVCFTFENTLNNCENKKFKTQDVFRKFTFPKKKKPYRKFFVIGNDKHFKKKHTSSTNQPWKIFMVNFRKKNNFFSIFLELSCHFFEHNNFFLNLKKRTRSIKDLLIHFFFLDWVIKIPFKKYLDRSRMKNLDST